MNPNHVSIGVHTYRWRLAFVDGDSRFDEMERRLAGAPNIVASTVTIEGDANGAPHPEPASYAAKFTGRYVQINGGVGHNLPQGAPQAFVDAIREAIDLARGY